MKQKILLLLIAICIFPPIFADIVSTPLGNKLRSIFPELKEGYIDLNKNGSLDRLEDMDEQISDFLVQDDQLQVQETLEFIKNNYRYFPVRALETVRDALNSPEGTINELIGLNYGTTINQLIEKRIAMGDYGLYLPQSARKKAMDEMSTFLEMMNSAYKKEGSGAEQEFTTAKDSLYSMLDKGYPLPEPLSIKEKEILESTLINTLIREQRNTQSVNTALYTLGIMRSGRGIPYIIPLVSNDQFALNSIRSLGSIGNLEAMDLLLVSLDEDPEETKKVAIIRALGAMGAKESLQPLLNILKDENLSEITLKAILESLGKIASLGTKDRRISTALAKYLNSADPALRIIAVKGLSAFSDQATVASLLGLFRKERSENVLLSLVERAKYINNPSIISSIIGLLQNPQTSIELQMNCLDTIGAHPEGIKGINGVLTALSSPEQEIREAAYSAAVDLYKTNSAALVGGLSRTVNSNKDPLFQQQAAKLFAELPDQGSINSLFIMLNTPDPEVKRYATLALYRIRPVGNVRITTELNKMVSNETEPLDVRINAVRALGAAGFDNANIKVEQTLITAASMRDQKYAQLRLYAIRALGQMPSISSENIDTIISIAARERDPSIKEEAVQTIARIGITDPEKAIKISDILENLNLNENIPLALMLCEILGETGMNDFIPTGMKLSELLKDTSSKRRLAYAFYMVGTEDGYESLIRMANDESLINFISSLAESTNKIRLKRVVERLKRSETDSALLELISIIEAEVLIKD